MRKQNEHNEQVAFFRWARLQEGIYPELALMFAIPNGGHRHISVARKLKAEGVKAGVPDIFLPISRGEYCGLFIEMKTGKNKLTESQRKYKIQLETQGYYVEVCYDWEQASKIIGNYLE